MQSRTIVYQIPMRRHTNNNIVQFFITQNSAETDQESQTVSTEKILIYQSSLKLVHDAELLAECGTYS